VQRVIDLLAQQPVGGDRVGHVRRLDRDLEVLEVQALHHLDELERGGDERIDGVLALQRVQVLGQRAGVDADAHGRARGLGPLGHLPHLLRAADVAGVQTHAVGACVDGLEREGVVEVDVRDHRDRRLAHDRPQRLDIVVARHGHAHDVRSRLGHGADLVHRGLQVGRLGLGHRLHGDRRAAPDQDAAHAYLALGGHTVRV
jgi:hypothetical protein